MLHTVIVPRIPFAVRPIPGVPGPPMQPIPLRLDGVDGVAHTLAVCYLHLLGLHALYARLGVRRPLGRLHDLTTSMHPVVHRVCGVVAVRAALTQARLAVDAAEDDSSILGHGLESGWWSVALQASLALGVWYELTPGADRFDVDFASHSATAIRRILGSVFEPRVAAAIQESAHGDGAGDLLAQVADSAIALGAFVGAPS